MNEADVRILRVGVGSARRIATLQAAAFPEPWGEGFVTSLMHLPGTIAFVAEADGAPLGFILARALAGQAEILSIAVETAGRRRGVATALLEQALSAAIATGAESVHLEVDVENAPAIALYERAGFARSGVRRRYYASGADALVLRRRLIRD